EYTILGAGRPGGYAQYVTAPGVNVIPKPKGLTFAEAAALPLVFLTAWHMLKTRARLQPGEPVLVWGAGSGVGSAAIQIAKLLGDLVTAVTGGEATAAGAGELGGEHVID